MDSKEKHTWHFIDDQGTFELKHPQQNSYLYFPLVNENGMMSSVTPTLNGDAKLNQNTFLLLPVSVEDLHNTRSARNFWVRVNGEPWSVTGNSARQIPRSTFTQEEDAILQAGFLWHQIKRTHAEKELTVCVVNFVPADDAAVELMQVTLTNQGSAPLELEPIAAIPIYGRSAENLRDHRHVTSLLHRTTCHQFGVMVKPSMSFDERGHVENQTIYAVLGVDAEGQPPRGFIPLVEDFIGEGGNFEWPKAVVQAEQELWGAGDSFEGFESMGAFYFQKIYLEPGESRSYILMLTIIGDERQIDTLLEAYGSAQKFSHHLEKTKSFWQEKPSTLQFNHQDARLDGWLQWVTLQPTLRRIMGNSFLPYHDYGRGGRGWRDLWQDLMAILLTEHTAIDQTLLSNFAGVRMDGSNATIVGSKPGEFKADRNSIPRVWMDHGAWPLLTTKLYLDQTGDIHFLLREQSYFRDHLTHRCQEIDHRWKPEQGTILKSTNGDLVKGTILEHLLVQHLTAFFNVGEHNLIRLEGGDWNDGLDMASERGESVAFSAMYAGNLQILSELCCELIAAGVGAVSIASELFPLFDRISSPIEYNSVQDKQTRLQEYFDSVQGDISGKKKTLSLKALGSDLQSKAEWLASHIRRQEWISETDERGWFNGYYDNRGQRVEGDHPLGVRMTLTGQVFPLMAGVATNRQAQKIVQAAEDYLYDPALNGYHLNTDFKSDFPELGRAFGFAYGHKENGAAFSHMSVMFSYALYCQGLAEEAWQILAGLYHQSQDFSQSRIYPGIPEYFNPRGRGMYPYLTGSAAWYIFTLLTEAFGIKGHMGNLKIRPKLVRNQFKHADQIQVQTIFAGKSLTVIFKNPGHLTFGQYAINTVIVNSKAHQPSLEAESIEFPRNEVLDWPDQTEIVIDLLPKKAD